MNFSWRLTWPVKIHQSEQSGQTSFYRSKFKQLTSKLKTPEGQKTSSTKGKKDENTDQRVPVMTPVRPLSYLFIYLFFAAITAQVCCSLKFGTSHLWDSCPFLELDSSCWCAVVQKPHRLSKWIEVEVLNRTFQPA